MSIHVYATGIVHISVCVEKGLPVEEVESLANSVSPTGISSDWKVTEPKFASGDTNPCPCNNQPAEREHYLLTC